MFRNSSTYIYLAVALGLFCYLTFIDKKIPGTKEQEEAETELFKLNPDDVTGLEITNVHGIFIFQKKQRPLGDQKPGRHPRRRRRRGRRSSTRSPSPSPSGSSRSTEAPTSDTANLKEWGLVPPAERVVIHTKDKKLRTARRPQNGDQRQRLCPRLGPQKRTGPDHSQHGQGRPGKGPLRFPQPQRLRFRRRQGRPRSPRASPTRATTPGQQCEVDLKDGKWTLQMPLVARASDTDVQALLNKILGLRAVDFVTDDASNLSPYGLTSPSRDPLRHASTARTSTWSCRSAAPCPNKPDQVYAQRLKSNSVFTLTKSSVDDLLKAAAQRARPARPSLRSRQGHGPELLLPEPKRARCAAEHGLWNTVGDAAGRADVGKVTDILAKLSQLETTPVAEGFRHRPEALRPRQAAGQNHHRVARIQARPDPHPL